MTTEIRRKIAFALSMGMITTGIISFTLVATNLGLTGDFAASWLRSWALSYAIVIPAILLISPALQARIDRLIG